MSYYAHLVLLVVRHHLVVDDLHRGGRVPVEQRRAANENDVVKLRIG